MTGKNEKSFPEKRKNNSFVSKDFLLFFRFSSLPPIADSECEFEEFRFLPLARRDGNIKFEFKSLKLNYFPFLVPKPQVEAQTFKSNGIKCGA